MLIQKYQKMAKVDEQKNDDVKKAIESKIRPHHSKLRATHSIPKITEASIDQGSRLYEKGQKQPQNDHTHYASGHDATSNGNGTNVTSPNGPNEGGVTFN